MSNYITNVLSVFGEESELANIINSVKPTDDFESENFSIENYYPTGDEDWYNWRIDNWGTKWDAFEVSEYYDDSDNFKIAFFTANATPIGALIKLSELFPNVEVSCIYSGDDFGIYCGEYSIKNGEVVNSNHYIKPTPVSIDFSKNIFRMAKSLWNTFF